MTTKRRWTEQEDKQLLDKVADFKAAADNYTDDEIFAVLADDFRDRTPVALNRRFYKLTAGGSERQYIRKDEKYSSFLEGIQALKSAYDEATVENRKLKKRVEELEQQMQDYEAMARIMDKARKLVVTEQLGEVEHVRLKMDQNGNLERAR
jgi:hypothetical protein